MHRTFLLNITPLLVAVLAAAAIAPSSIANDPGFDPAHVLDSNVYVEDFADYADMEDLDNTDWDTASKHLALLPRDGVRQSAVSIAADGQGGFVVVWADTREGQAAIYAQRLDAAGMRLWPSDIRVSADGASTQKAPIISSDRNGHLVVVWYEARTGCSEIFAQSLDSHGARRWASDVRVATASCTTDRRAPSVATDAQGNSMVAWVEGAYGGGTERILAQHLSLNGTRIWSADMPVSVSAENAVQRYPKVGVDGTGAAVIAWVDWRELGGNPAYGDYGAIYAQRLSTDGRPLWAQDTYVSPQGTWVQFDTLTVTVLPDDDTLIAWQTWTLGRGATYINRLTVSGVPLESPQRVNSDPSGSYGNGTPAMATNSSGDVVMAWMDSQCRYIRAQAIDSQNHPLWSFDVQVNDPDSPCWGAYYWYIGVAMDDTLGAVITWGDETYSWGGDIRAQRLSFDGQRQWRHDRPVNDMSGSSDQGNPKIRTDSTGHLTVAWVDWRNARGDVYLQRFDPQGNAQWLNDVQIATGPQGENGLTDLYDIAIDRNGIVTIVWSTEVFGPGTSIILAQRIDTSGNKLWVTDKQINQLEGNAYYPAVTTMPDESVLIAWFKYDDNSSFGVYAQMLDAGGNVIWTYEKKVNGASNRPSAGTGSLQAASNQTGSTTIAWIAWQNDIQGTQIYAQALDAGGNRLWPMDVSVSPNNKASYDLRTAVDSSGDTYLVWNTPWTIYAQKLNAQGQKAWTADVQVNSDSGQASSGVPEITLDLTQNLTVVWSSYTGKKIYAQKLAPNGNRLWSNDRRISADSSLGYTQSRPSVVVANNDAMFTAWEDDRKGNLDVFVQGINRVNNAVWPVDMQVVLPDHFYFPYGSAQSRTIDNVPGDIREAIITADYQLNGGSVQCSLTNNGGADWFRVTPGVTHVFTTVGSDLRWSAELTADPLWPRTPVINSLRIEYSTQVPYADDYESDDACVTARPIAINGAAQSHTFHQQADADWVWFDAIAGATYVIQTANTQANADTVLELHDMCANPPLRGDDNAFGSTAQITWQATTSDRLYVKVANHDPALFGAQTGYDLSVRTVSRLPVAVIVAGHDDSYRLQANINYTADMAYRAFLNSGVPKANLRYFSRSGSRDVDGNGKSDDIFGPPYPADVRAAIQDWARERGVALGVPFYLVLADHGDYDQFLADGTAGKIMATDLDLWLSNLEATTGADNINVIIEACRSGSFIDATALGPVEISGRNRAVIASTSSSLNAYAHEGYGAYFSDAFWTGLGEGNDLKTAFDRGKQAVQTTGLNQEPWLDDNGDAVADDRDGTLASGRGLSGAFAGSPPIIDWAVSGPVRDGRAMIRAQVRDDFGVRGVRGEIYAPDFVEPPPSPDGTTPQLNLPVVTLTPAGNDIYAADYDGFSQPGRYRVVLYAYDDDGNQALPLVVSVTTDQGGATLYLPLVLR